VIDVVREQSEFRGINVDKWQVSVTTAPKQKSIPRQRIKIEIANIEAYTSETMALQANYEFLPDGYADTLLRVETLDEIMADKLISLANTEKYIRHRDIWDLRWLYPFLTKEVTRLYDQVLRHLSAPGAGESPEFVI
jgi:predicted nucleotidyltransferase component of viral defense system